MPKVYAEYHDETLFNFIEKANNILVTGERFVYA